MAASDFTDTPNDHLTKEETDRWMVALKQQGPRKKRRVRLDQKLLDENNQAKITKRKSGGTFGGYNKPQSGG